MNLNNTDNDKKLITDKVIKSKSTKKSDKPPKQKSKRKSTYNKNDVVRKTFRNFHISKLRVREIEILTKERMSDIGVYNTSYDGIIHIFATMTFEYERCLEQFKQEGMQYEVDTGTGSTKKSGLVSAMETLRKDIGSYSDRLQLNPKARGSESNVDNPNSPLEQFFLKFDKKI